MPSQLAEFFNQMFRDMPKDPPGTLHDFAAEREGGRQRPKPPIPEGVCVKDMDLNGNYGELITKEGNQGPLVMYIHGGGFTTGAAQERREITYDIAAHRGCNVIANNYRLSPENKWPSHLMDCVDAYQAILDMGYDPKHLVVMGESAGATLTIALALYLRDHSLPLPAVCVAFSICCDQWADFPSHSENAKTDAMLGDAINRPDQLEAVFGTGEAAQVLRQSTYASPYYADYTGMPPIFLAASDTETLYDDSVYLYEKLKAAGHPAALDIQHGLCHAYPMFPRIPESIETLDRAFAFIQANL